MFDRGHVRRTTPRDDRLPRHPDQLPAGVDPSEAAMRLLGVNSSGPESGINSPEGGSSQARPGGATPPPSPAPDIAAAQRKPEIGQMLSAAMQT